MRFLPGFARRKAGKLQARRHRHPRVSVVVPAFNEQNGIDWVLAHIPQWVFEVVVVDGLSTDLTEVSAYITNPDIIVVHQHTRGKGAALRAGFAAARGDIVVMLDADGSTDPREIGSFVAALRAGADFVKGSRSLDGGGSEDFTLARRAGNRAFVLLVNRLFGANFTDLCYGYCAFWRRHLDALGLSADGFEIETELVLHAVKAGLDIREVPSFELRRRAGKSNLNAIKDGQRVLKTVLGEWHRREPWTDEPPTQVELMAQEKPAVECQSWRPAGKDRRRLERRQQSLVRGEYPGPERRQDERRVRPPKTTIVYVASDEAREPRPPRPIPRHGPRRRGGARAPLPMRSCP